uniref:DUF4408 domain-containing protein n=1 Tax=Ananas comosus var. bracteatus TaxID=296719 RepID=A0A6V7NNT3_ANACO|nr:unnamed protein product [Ananas comosus var. bracteatus]
MDTVQIEKLLAMKRYAKKQLLVSSLVQYSLQASVLGLFLSSPSWLPRLYCTAKLLLSATMGPKCLFILSNIIIIFLVGESKISRPPRGNATPTRSARRGVGAFEAASRAAQSMIRGIRRVWWRTILLKSVERGIL